MDNNQNKQSGQFQVDLPQEVGKGVYSNFAIIGKPSSACPGTRQAPARGLAG